MNEEEEQELRSIIREEIVKVLKSEFTNKIMREYLFKKDTLDAIWVIYNGKARTKT